MKNIASYEFDRLCYMSYSISQESPKSNCNLLHISNSSLCIDQCGFLHDAVCTRSSWIRSSCSGNLRNISLKLHLLKLIIINTKLFIQSNIANTIIFQSFASKMYGSFAFMIPIFVALSTFGGVNGILLTSSR